MPDVEAANYLNVMIEAVHNLNKLTVGYATDLFEGSLGICRVEECTIGSQSQFIFRFFFRDIY